MLRASTLLGWGSVNAADFFASPFLSRSTSRRALPDTDAQAMARDHKLNVWQKTTTQLRKQVEVYKKLLEM